MIIQLSLNKKESTAIQIEGNKTIVSKIHAIKLIDSYYVNVLLMCFLDGKPAKFNVKSNTIDITVESYCLWHQIFNVENPQLIVEIEQSL